LGVYRGYVASDDIIGQISEMCPDCLDILGRKARPGELVSALREAEIETCEYDIELDFVL